MTGRDVSAWRQRDTVALEAWYPAGAITAADTDTSSGLVVNQLYAVPWIEAEGSRLNAMAIRNIGTSASAIARLGIYKATSITNLYPSELVRDAGSVGSLSTAAAKSVALSPVLELDSNTLYWFVLLFGTAVVQVRHVVPNGSLPIFGADANLGINLQRGLSVALAYGSLPSSFPAGASLITSGSLPAIFARLTTA